MRILLKVPETSLGHGVASELAQAFERVMTLIVSGVSGPSTQRLFHKLRRYLIRYDRPVPYQKLVEHRRVDHIVDYQCFA